MDELNVDELNGYAHNAVTMVMEYAPKVLLALLILIVGMWLISGVRRVVEKALSVRHIDDTLRPFLLSLVSWILKALLFLSVASTLGVKTTSFVAILGAAGLAVGLALQGSLGNFAGGVLILIFRPFEVGHLISAQGELGVVQEIQIFCTIITTPQNKRVVIPNGPLSNGNITNFSAEGKLRVDLTVGISYSADIKQAKEVLSKVLADHPKVLAEPAPMVAVTELADSSVNLAVRPWATPADYWDVYFEVLEQAKLQLDAAEIGIPFPQRDVHLYQHSA